MFTFTDKITNILENNKSVSLRFLSLKEQTHLTRKKDVLLYGGYPDAEKKRAYFYQDIQDDIVCFKIVHNQKYLELTHQNILGTLLSNSITTDSIGDILPKQGLFFVTKEISKEIIQSFTKISNVAIELEVYNKEDIISEKELEELRTTLDSLRLDLVISKICKISRSKANVMLMKELIKINHQVLTKSTITIKEFDTISIRKYGRFIIKDTKNTSKKGKIIVKYGKYV